MASKILAKNARGTLLTNQTIPRYVAPFGNHPHLVDFYVPNGSTALACVFLHGGGGSKETVANQLLLCRGTPAPANVWWRLLEAFQCVIALPQGQHCTVANTGPWNPNGVTTETPANPQGVAVWSNWFFWSGADDVQFLKDLSTYISVNFSIGLGKILAGHSAGGMEVQRMAYETAASSYIRMVTISGPANDYYAKPGYVGSFPNVPMLSIIGALDENVGVWNGVAGPGSHFYDAVWHQQPKNRTVANVEYPLLDHFVGEFTGYQQRVLDRTGTVVQQSDGVTTAAQRLGTVTKWRDNTARQELWYLSDASHGLKEIQQANGSVLVDLLAWSLSI